MQVARGQHHGASETVESALKYHSEDSLAQFLRIKLLQVAGDLMTSDEVRAAQTKIEALSGKLPSKVLEEERASMSADLDFWHLATSNDIRTCLLAKDAANLLICGIGKLFFAA